MIRMYMTVLQPRSTAQIARELLEEGMSKDRIHIYSARPGQIPSMPVEISRYRSPTGLVAVGGFVGALIGALVGLPLLWLGTLGIAPLLVFMVAGGIGGAIFSLWLGNGPHETFFHIEEALSRGETVMMLEVDKGRVSEVESKVKSRHPEVSVLDAGLRVKSRLP